jgi:cytosine/creatinine deaminase
MAGFVTLPPTGAYRLRNASIPGAFLDRRDELVRADIEIRGGEISALGSLRGATLPVVDLDGSMVWPRLVDAHTHLDKGHIWPRAENHDRSRAGALAATTADRAAHWTAEDVRRRMEFGLQCAYAHGTAAVRTHIDSAAPQHRISWPVLIDVRERWADRIHIQGSALVPLEAYRDEAFAIELADMVAQAGGVLGAVCIGRPPDIDVLLTRVFTLAGERGLALDFHCDETGDPASDALRHVAKAVLRVGWRDPIPCGHCCSLAVQPLAEAQRTLDLAAEARLALVALPLINAFLQDRVPGRTPRWRGLTVLHEAVARGVRVAVASDNCRDPFFAWGDHDLVEVFRTAVRLGHLDHPLGGWPATIGTAPAEAMGLLGAGRIGVNRPADLILFRARSWSEMLARPQIDRVVVHRGQQIDTTLPDYRALDDLMRA